MNNFKILAIGDVVGCDSVAYLGEKLRNYKRSNGIDLVIVNLVQLTQLRD